MYSCWPPGRHSSGHAEPPPGHHEGLSHAAAGPAGSCKGTRAPSELYARAGYDVRTPSAPAPQAAAPSAIVPHQTTGQPTQAHRQKHQSLAEWQQKCMETFSVFPMRSEARGCAATWQLVQQSRPRVFLKVCLALDATALSSITHV